MVAARGRRRGSARLPSAKGPSLGERHRGGRHRGRARGRRQGWRPSEPWGEARRRRRILMSEVSGALVVTEWIREAMAVVVIFNE